MHSQEVLLYI
nr:unnamed protein product [Callosobruchus chinensis]